MNAISDAPLRWDPYDPQLVRDPYPTYRRLREEVAQLKAAIAKLSTELGAGAS